MEICEQILMLAFVTFSHKDCSKSSRQEKCNLDCEGLFRHAQAENSPKTTGGVKSICNLPYKQL